VELWMFSAVTEWSKLLRNFAQGQVGHKELS